MGIPTTLADAASAIQDGTLGVIETASIGDIVISALIGLNVSNELDVTQKPIEQGYDIADAAIEIPTRIEMFVCLANPDFSVEAGLTAALSGSVSSFTETWRDKKDKLYKYYSDREIIDVTTHENKYTSMIIESITPEWDVEENYDAFFCSVRLLKINIVQEAASGLLDAAEEAIGGL